jgi:hypothetical protein
VPAGDSFTESQRLELARLVSAAEQATGLRVVVSVGSLPGGRADAEALLAAQTSRAAESVVVAVDPSSRALEIVTGSRAAAQVDDRTCALASLAMTSTFAAGDLLGGLRNGLQIIADHGRRGVRRHLDTV